MAFLKILTGDQKGEKIEIDRDRVVMGRSSKNAVFINDPSVSGKHCAIVREGRTFTLQDMESTNGTRLNDIHISEYILSPKDVIKIGVVEILFDGKDIDPPAQTVSNAQDTQITVRLESTAHHQRSTPATIGFEAKKPRKWGWPILIAVISLLALAAFGWFLAKLLGK